MHHIVSDGWSLGVLIKEVATLYEAYSQGLDSPLPELPVQYSDFALWQRSWFQGEELERQLAYWRNQLTDRCQSLNCQQMSHGLPCKLIAAHNSISICHPK